MEIVQSVQLIIPFDNNCDDEEDYEEDDGDDYLLSLSYRSDTEL